MSSQSETLSCHLYTSSVTVEGFSAVLGLIESLLPTPPLVYRIDDAGEIHKLAQPAAWLDRQLAADDLALVCNGDENRLVSFSASDMLQEPPVLDLTLRLRSLVYFDHAFELLGRLGPAVDAYRGRIGTVTTGARMVDEYRGDITDWLPPEATIVPPPLPATLSWIMYWSAQTCAMLDFSPHDPRASLFFRCVPCGQGAVLLQLTEDAVDLDIPAHRAAVDAAYDAFPQVPQLARPGRS